MNSTKQFYEDIDKYRAIQITTILGVKNNGRPQKIRCPFHNEKTPSFMLYQDNSYYCFGCAKHGSNAIDFCRDLGYSFHDTLQELKPYL